MMKNILKIRIFNFILRVSCIGYSIPIQINKLRIMVKSCINNGYIISIDS